MSQGQLHMFVSHASQDSAFTSALVQALRGAGVDVWYDQDNLGAGVLRQQIMRELSSRPVFLVMLSHAAFISRWVQDECEWAYNLSRREPNRLLLPVTAAPYEPGDFNALLFLEGFKRIEDPLSLPYSQEEAIQRTLDLLELSVQADTTPDQDATAHRQDLAAELMRHGQIESARGMDELALAFYQCAAHLAPSTEEAWFLLGYALNELDRWEQALHALRHAHRLSPEHAEVWGNLGYALNRLERFDEGLAASERAVALEPTFATGWNNVGWALLNLQRLPEALAAFDHALALAPDDPVFVDNRAETLRALGRDPGQDADLQLSSD